MSGAIPLLHPMCFQGVDTDFTFFYLHATVPPIVFMALSWLDFGQVTARIFTGNNVLETSTASILKEETGDTPAVKITIARMYQTTRRHTAKHRHVSNNTEHHYDQQTTGFKLRALNLLTARCPNFSYHSPHAICITYDKTPFVTWRHDLRAAKRGTTTWRCEFRPKPC